METKIENTYNNRNSTPQRYTTIKLICFKMKSTTNTKTKEIIHLFNNTPSDVSQKQAKQEKCFISMISTTKDSSCLKMTRTPTWEQAVSWVPCRSYRHVSCPYIVLQLRHYHQTTPINCCNTRLPHTVVPIR